MLQASCPTAAHRLHILPTALKRPKCAWSPIGMLCHNAEVLIFDPLPIFGSLRCTRACIKRHRTPCLNQSLIFQDRVVLRSYAFPSFCFRLLIRSRFDLLQFVRTTMIIHAGLRFIVLEWFERGLISVNRVRVQQAHELGCCIVRTTAIANDNKSRAIENNGENERKSPRPKTHTFRPFRRRPPSRGERHC